ncbi:MAG: hypothetical protein IBX64_00745 [Actinobacteria bacterium]|nr:hypothetical protein [Actinomycetota bacterium]
MKIKLVRDGIVLTPENEMEEIYMNDFLGLGKKRENTCFCYTGVTFAGDERMPEYEWTITKEKIEKLPW